MNKYYSQIDPAYESLYLAPHVSVSGYGCFLWAIAMLAQTDPVELLNKCKNEKYALTNNGLLYPAKVAKLAGMTYLDRYAKPSKNEFCIVHVERTFADEDGKVAKQAHFMVYFNGVVIDPLDKKPAPRFYNFKDVKILNYRLFDGVKIQIGERSTTELISNALDAFKKSDWNKERKEARSWAMKMGISNGERPTDPLTREEQWVMFRRFYEGFVLPTESISQ